MQMQKKIELKKYIVRFCICFGTLGIIWVFFYIIQKKLEERNIINNLKNDNFDIAFQFDSITDDGKNFFVDGWAFKLNVDTSEGNVDILLYDRERKKIVDLDMEYIVRNDVNQYFLCEYDYSKSGFRARVKSKKLKLEDVNYEIVVADKVGKKFYKTNTYISKGKLVYTDPEEFVPLDVAGTDLEKIVNEGILRVYRKDIGIYVYQYENELYWIADENFSFETDNANLEYTVYTTQPWNLDIGIETNVLDMHFFFEEEELKDLSVGKYRICKMEIPKEFSIYKIETGVWTRVYGWYWRNEFTLFYEEMIK